MTNVTRHLKKSKLQYQMTYGKVPKRLTVGRPSTDQTARFTFYQIEAWATKNGIALDVRADLGINDTIFSEDKLPIDLEKGAP